MHRATSRSLVTSIDFALVKLHSFSGRFLMFSKLDVRDATTRVHRDQISRDVLARERT
jgi:hypothetical protein